MITASYPNLTSILLWSGHTGEGYLSPLLDGAYKPDLPRRFVLLDLDQLEEMPFIRIEDEDVPSWMDASFGTLVHISGTDAEMKNLFDLIADAVEDGPQGADDDTFDYWPSAVDAVEVFAKDMFSTTRDSHYMARLGMIAAKNKEVMEFEDNAERIIKLTTPWRDEK